MSEQGLFKVKYTNEQRVFDKNILENFSQGLFGEEEKLHKIGDDFHDQYVNADPFPHIKFDHFLPFDVAKLAHDSFPHEDELDFYKYDNPLEKKLAFDQVSKLPRPIFDLLSAMNQSPFLLFLEKLTGIEGLIPDPYYRGGGIHSSQRGGKLDVHVDFNIHPKLELHRRLNVIIYLNQSWRQTFNGDLQLWKGHKDKDTGKHVLTDLKKRIYPHFNTFACFDTSEHSYHGFPTPIECPPGMSRKSIATYYYTSTRKNKSKPHSTVFIKTPDEDDSLEELRDKRSKGRTSSNVEDGNLS